MKYMCIAYEEEQKLNALSQAEWQALRRETLDYVEALRQSGRLIDARPLRSATTASTVRVRNGKVAVTDGPFAETKEQLMGLYVVDCATLEDAVAVAERLAFDTGVFEIRPTTWLDPGGLPAKMPPPPK